MTSTIAKQREIWVRGVPTTFKDAISQLSERRGVPETHVMRDIFKELYRLQGPVNLNQPPLQADENYWRGFKVSNVPRDIKQTFQLQADRYGVSLSSLLKVRVGEYLDGLSQNSKPRENGY